MKHMYAVIRENENCLLNFKKVFKVSDGKQVVECNIAGLMGFIREFDHQKATFDNPFLDLRYIGCEITLYQELMKQLIDYPKKDAYTVINLLRVARAVDHKIWSLFHQYMVETCEDFSDKYPMNYLRIHGLQSLLEHCSVKEREGNYIVDVSEKIVLKDNKFERRPWFAIDWHNPEEKFILFDRVSGWKRERGFQVSWDNDPEYMEEVLFKKLIKRF